MREIALLDKNQLVAKELVEPSLGKRAHFSIVQLT